MAKKFQNLDYCYVIALRLIYSQVYKHMGPTLENSFSAPNVK